MNNDSKYEQSGLPRKNADSFRQAIDNMDGMIREQDKKISSLNNSVSTLTNRINELEKLLQLTKMKLVGTGPTV